MNEFKIKKGLIVNGSGSTILDIQGSQGQLFSVTDQLSGSLFSVNDISGIPILEVFSDDTVKLGTFGSEAIIVEGSTIKLPSTVNDTGDFVTVNGNNEVGIRTPSQVLSDIGAQAALTNPITGTGTSGQVSFFNGTTTQTGDNGLFWDNTNKRLGIGTTSPAFKLNILETDNIINIVGTSETAFAGQNNMVIGHGYSLSSFGSPTTSNIIAKIEFNGDATPAGFFGDDIVFSTTDTVMTPSPGDSSSERMRIKAEGNVGIGTSSPDTKLDVNGDVTITDKIIHKGDTDTFISFPSDDNIVVSTNDLDQIRVDNGAGDAGRVRVETQLHAGDLSSSSSSYGFHSGVSSIIQSDGFLTGSSLVSGEILTQQISGVRISVGMLVYLETDGEWYPASASGIGKVDKMLGIALNNAGTAGVVLDVLIDGILNYTSETPFIHQQIADPATPGAPLYASTTNGRITEIAPSSSGNIVKIIGHNISSVSGEEDIAVVRFKPDNSWIEL